MLRYLATLPRAKVILWCYLAWYLAIAVRYFDPSPALWISSVGIAVMIGYALTLAARSGDRALDPWVVFRLYLFPFCVSSYSALIKGKGFFLLFPPRPGDLVAGAMACLTVLLTVGLARLHPRFRRAA